MNSVLVLSNVTLFAVACTNVDETIKALRQSMKGIKYEKVLLFTHEKRNLDQLGIKVINIEKLDYKGYNHFVLYRLKDYIESDYSLLVQNDGFVTRPDRFDKRFFDYDYIGAPWPKDVHFTPDGENVRVGNGGFSFRSKKLLHALDKLKLPFADKGTGYFHEDGVISVYYRQELEAYGIKYAPVEIASLFSREVVCEDSAAYPFGFHGKGRTPKFLFARPLLKKIGLEV